jgi:hypothetical protein
MKNLFFLIFAMFVISCGNSGQQDQKTHHSNLSEQPADTTDLTNNFYDNEKCYPLQTGRLEIEGEISHPGNINLKGLPLRSIIVKEALPEAGGNTFEGAYRYDGYSLFDMLNYHTPDKNNREAFPPIIDLFVVIENALGEKVVFSWGEIFYPNHLHEIIYATRVMRIVPSKTKELWPLPTEARIVAGHDLLTSRNISNPVKITVKSASREFEITKGMSPMFAPEINVFVNENKTMTIDKPAKGIRSTSYETIFYGRGRGIHSTTPFTGQMLKQILAGQQPISEANLRESYLIFAAKDGYRGVYSYSEIFNRNDQAELLLIYNPEDFDGGAFRLFPAGDFFSDRAIKSVEQIYFETLQ